MQAKETLYRYKDWFIMGGLVIGLLSIFEYLPKELGPVGQYSKWVYAAVILLAGGAFYEFHWGSSKYGQSSVSYTQRVPARNISNPQHMKRLAQQRGGTPPTKGPTPPVDPMGGSASRPSQRIFDTFKKD